mgnify:CR=1 FL=1
MHVGSLVSILRRNNYHVQRCDFNSLFTRLLHYDLSELFRHSHYLTNLVTQYGHYGYHREDTFKLKYNLVLIWKYLYANGITYNPILGLVKASMILLYLRLGGTKTGVRTACCVLFIFNFLFITGALVADIFQCWPITYIWDRQAMDQAAQVAAGATDPGVYHGYPVPTGFKDGAYVQGGECINMGNFLLITAGISILTDLLILLIPVYMVFDLQLTPKKKFVVLLVLCMGVA